MWFSPNHRANHALWFWFPCITGLKPWNHLIHIHTYMHRHTCMHTQLSRYRFCIQIQNPARAVSHHRQHIPNVSCVMNITAEITAQCSLRSISCGDWHNFVLPWAFCFNKLNRSLTYQAAAGTAVDLGFKCSQGKACIQMAWTLSGVRC